MAVFTKEVEELTRLLIENITEFSPEEENYDMCYQFCKSNIKYHRYLDVNSTNVTRAIQNVITKFKVNTLPERAHQLSTLFESFLDYGPFPNSDLHYKVLHFLLESSVSPTNADYCLPDHLEPLVERQQRDNFDWKAYLMEGIEIPSFYDSTSEEISSLSEVESSSDEEEENTIGRESSAIMVACDDTSHDRIYSRASSWLKDHVTSIYWDKYSFECTHTTGHPSCNFLFDSSSFTEAKAVAVVTEVQIVRETLWMLMGVVGGCVYKREDLSVNRNIAMAHSSLLSLHGILNEFSQLGCQLKVIRNRVSESIDPYSNSSQVFQGSMYFIHSYIDKLNCCLRDMEMNISKKQNFISLLSLKKQLNQYKKEVYCVYSVLESLTNQNWILDVLWTHLDYHDSMSDRQCVDIIFPWMLATLRPYMEIMNKWLTEGKLEDPQSEFLVKKNPLKPKSWTDSFTLNDCQPLCIKPLIEKIFVAGKSWCYIESLDKKSSTSPPTPLFDEFISHLCHYKDDRIADDDSPLDIISTCTSDIDCQAMTPYTHLSPPRLVMVGINSTLSSYLTDSSSNTCNQTELPRQNQSHAPLAISYCTPIVKAITLSIQQCIDARYKKATSSLTNILKTEYKLLEHFNTARQFFLMEAGHIMHIFSGLLFEKMMSGTYWLERSFLNSILEESLQEQYSKYENELRVEVDSTIPAVVSFESLKALSLQYEVKWPIDILFPQVILDTYNQIFSFLLQVKFAKWCLIQIDIRKYRGQSKEYSTLVHRLFLFRAKLLHFVNSLNHYLLTRILHTSGIEFQESVSKASDLDTIIVLHANYVNQIHDRCLLNKKAHLVKEAISRTLTLTLTLYNLWNKGIEYFKWYDGNRIEVEFMRCIHFLISCLNTHIKRGSFPHLETLSFTLSSLLSGPKYFQQH